MLKPSSRENKEQLLINDESVFLSVCKFIESPQFAAQYYVSANTSEWLYNWIAEQEAVDTLIQKALSDLTFRKRLIEHTLDLFFLSYTPGYRSQYEASVCCYVYALSRVPDIQITQAIKRIQNFVGPQHGWLRVILNRLSRYRSINIRHSETYLSAGYALSVTNSSQFFAKNASNQSQMISHSTEFDVVSLIPLGQ